MTKSEYIAKHGEEAYQKYREQKKQYYQEHKEEKREYNKHYRQQHKEQRREWQQQNKTKIAEYNKHYCQQYNSTPKGRAVKLANSYKWKDRKHNRGECTLTAKWIEEHIFTSKCHYCGESDWHKLGCDRISNDLPHTPDNCVPCCGDCNNERQKMNFAEFCEKKGVALN